MQTGRYLRNALAISPEEQNLLVECRPVVI